MSNDDPTGRRIEHTGPSEGPVGDPWTDQEDAANSTKDVDSVKAVAAPTQEDGLPDWPEDRADKGPGLSAKDKVDKED